MHTIQTIYKIIWVSECCKEKCVIVILIESECFDLEFIQKCCVYETGSGRAGRVAQGEGLGRDFDGMCLVIILTGTGSAHWGTERESDLCKEGTDNAKLENLYFRLEIAFWKQILKKKKNKSGSIRHSQDCSLQA